MMYHPIHLHGHTFQLIKADGTPGARKDTVIVLAQAENRRRAGRRQSGLVDVALPQHLSPDAGMQTRLDYVF